MSDIKEKVILENIKNIVETETPDVWKKIQETDHCKYGIDNKPLTTKTHRAYMPAAAAALCVIMTFAGVKYFNGPERQNNYVSTDRQIAGTAGNAPELAEDAGGRVPQTGAADIFRPFSKDVTATEASKALKFDIAAPSWVPEGFTMASSKLFSSNEDGSLPYMYSIEYKNSTGKLLTLNISKYMTEEEKLRSQPAPMPMPEDRGDTGGSVKNNTGKADGVNEVAPTPPDAVVDLPALTQDTPVQSTPGKNIAEPSLPSKAVDTPAISPSGNTSSQSRDIGGGSDGNPGKVIGSEPASVEFETIKINDIDVTLTVSSSKAYMSLSAFWFHNGGSYNIFSDGISKDNMLKIIESMIK